MTLPQRGFHRQIIIVLLAVLSAASTLLIAPAPASAADDQLTQLVLRRQAVFTNWLERYNVPGVMGEVGWPGDRDPAQQAKWNALASRWYQQIATKNVPVAYWGTGEASFLDPFQNGRTDAQISVIRSQPAGQRGMNLGGGEYQGGQFPSAAVIRQAAASGVTWVRLPFKWEELQPAAFGPLSEGRLAQLRAAVNEITAAGMTVELDNHNYNRYYGATASPAQLSDFWVKLAAQFPTNNISYGLMNEPYPDADANWLASSQQVLTALRNAGSDNLITVSGKFWSNAHRWSCQQPAPWISDPLNNYRYEAHTYFDAITEGHYNDHYDNTYGQAEARGGVATANECTFNGEYAGNGAPSPSGGHNVPGSAGQPGTTPTVPVDVPVGEGRDGYRVVTTAGQVYGFGTKRQTFGNAPAGSNIVALANTPEGRGYWLASASGQVFAFGNAQHLGDMAGRPLNGPIVGMATTPDGGGYWLLGRDGGIFSFGNAAFYGSTGNMRLNQPVVGITATRDGKGYWFVAADGGVFTFGTAAFHGSTGNLRLNQPVVGMSAAPRGDGYWLVAADGGIFAFGPNSPFHGSTGDRVLNAPIVGMVASPSGNGYRFVATDGGVFAFGDASFEGSLGATPPPSAVRSISG